MKLIFMGICLVFFSSCKTLGTATIEREGKAPIDAQIIEGKHANVIVLPRGQTETVSVKRSEIIDVDHPGTIEMIGGAVVVFLGGFFIWNGLSGLLSDDVNSFLNYPAVILGAVITTGGIVYFSDNYWKNQQSKSRFQVPQKRRLGFGFTPKLSTDGSGLSVFFSF